jgi:hypothetical protein
MKMARTEAAAVELLALKASKQTKGRAGHLISYPLDVILYCVWKVKVILLMLRSAAPRHPLAQCHSAKQMKTNHA